MCLKLTITSVLLIQCQTFPGEQSLGGEFEFKIPKGANQIQGGRGKCHSNFLLEKNPEYILTCRELFSFMAMALPSSCMSSLQAPPTWHWVT